MAWTLAAAVIMAVSAVATGGTAVKLRVRCGALDVSSVRFLFFVLYVYLCVWCSARTAYYVWMCTLRSNNDFHKDTTTSALTASEIDRMGIHGVLYVHQAKEVWVAAMVCIGDTGLFGVAVVVYALAYELFRITTHAMDRGVFRERAAIRAYCWAIHICLLLFVVTETTLAIVFKGYTLYTHGCLLACYVLQLLSTLYMAALLVALKLKGRETEAIHGEFIRSPIYMRLKRIMTVYVLFTAQFQLSSFFFYVTKHRDSRLNLYIGVSMLIFNATGLALSIITCCSQSCVLTVCQWCLPKDAEAQLFARSNLDAGPASDPPPQKRPVFVVTDIECSSALWAIDNGRLMQKATKIHDGILRALLVKYRGYEITTCGDSFHLAFHTIHEAVSYCLQVQLALLVAKWPKQLHDAISATRKQRVGVQRRIIFRGLRVRMGVHDAVMSDGDLVCDTHAVTGTMTYTGASKLIAEEVGEIGSGGQILATQRVADWLRKHEELVSVRFAMRHVKEYVIPYVHARLELFQVAPQVLQARLRHFPSPRAYQVGSSSLQLRAVSVGGAGFSNSLLEWRMATTRHTAICVEEEQPVDIGDDESKVRSSELCVYESLTTCRELNSNV